MHVSTSKVHSNVIFFDLSVLSAVCYFRVRLRILDLVKSRLRSIPLSNLRCQSIVSKVDWCVKRYPSFLRLLALIPFVPC